MSDPLEQLDYYSLLQIPRTASADAVRRAFHAFAAKYHPDRFEGAGAATVKIDRAAQIYRRGAEAYRVLCDPKQRKQYDMGLDQGRLRFDRNAPPPEAPPIVGQWPIKVKSPLARPFAVKAEQLYKAGDYGNCKTNLKLALQKDKGNAQIELLLKDVESRLGGGAEASQIAEPAAATPAQPPATGARANVVASQAAQQAASSPSTFSEPPTSVARVPKGKV